MLKNKAELKAQGFTVKASMRNSVVRQITWRCLSRSLSFSCVSWRPRLDLCCLVRCGDLYSGLCLSTYTHGDGKLISKFVHKTFPDLHKPALQNVSKQLNTWWFNLTQRLKYAFSESNYFQMNLSPISNPLQWLRVHPLPPLWKAPLNYCPFYTQTARCCCATIHLTDAFGRNALTLSFCCCCLSLWVSC